MKILVIGSRGSMGQRYCSILNYLGHKPIEYDIEHMDHDIDFDLDRCIIAVPTFFHTQEMVRVIMATGDLCKILVEKPMTTNDWDLTRFEPHKNQLRQVNNWEHLPTICPNGNNEISYNYFRAGKENDRWDVAQPRWLTREGLLHLSFQSPIFDVEINGHHITQKDVDKSYVQMIEYWLMDAPIGGMDFDQARRMIKWINP